MNLDPLVEEFNLLTKSEKRPIAGSITDVLRKAIMDGNIEANQKLSMYEVSKLFNVSRMPVREAFKKLESEGLVNIIPQKGVYVTDVSSKEMNELLDIRVCLEKIALELSFPYFDKNIIDELDKIIEGMESLTSIENQDRFVELSIVFHDTIYSFAGNSELKNLITQQRKKFSRYLRLRNVTPSRLVDILNEHREILEAIKQGNKNEALAALESHIRNVGAYDIELYLSYKRK